MNFILPNYIYRVKEIVRVIDGDTVDVIIDLGFYLNSLKRVRMIDLDTDEMRGGTIETKQRANMAKDRLEQLLSFGNVYIQTQMDKTGKYGRLLGKFFIVKDSSVIDVNGTLIEEGYQKGGIGTVFTEKVKSFPLTENK